MQEEKQALEQRVQRALLQYALMRPESAGVLAFSFLLTFVLSLFDTAIFGIPNATWMIVGIVAYLALAYSSYTDTDIAHKVVESLLRDDFTPGDIGDEELRAYLEEALDYRSRITDLITQRPDGALKVQLEGMANQFDEWIEEIYTMAQRLDEYRGERQRLHNGFVKAEQQNKEYKKRLARVSDEQLRADLERNIENNDRQIKTIQLLEATMARAKLRLEDTITAMATIYPQTLLLDAKNIDSSRYDRLAQEIADEVDELGDVLYAMDEVYATDTL